MIKLLSVNLSRGGCFKHLKRYAKIWGVDSGIIGVGWDGDGRKCSVMGLGRFCLELKFKNTLAGNA
jgi:hypothetical protein